MTKCWTEALAKGLVQYHNLPSRKYQANIKKRIKPNM